MLQRSGITHRTTSPYNPRANGAVERFNQTIENALAKVCNVQKDDWDNHIPLILLGYRSSKHSSTKMSPALVLLGRELTLPDSVHLNFTGIQGSGNADVPPSDLVAPPGLNIPAPSIDAIRDDEPSEVDALCARVAEAQEIEALALERISAAQRRQSIAYYKQHNKGRSNMPEVGDYVTLREHTAAGTGKRKMEHIWTTSYFEVVDFNTNKTQVIIRDSRGRTWGEFIGNVKVYKPSDD